MASNDTVCWNIFFF